MFDQALPLRVLIADQQANIRQALWMVCEQGLGMNVVGEAANVVELLTMSRTTHPDILLLEWGLPGTALADLVSTLRESDVFIIAVGARAEDHAAALVVPASPGV